MAPPLPLFRLSLLATVLACAGCALPAAAPTATNVEQPPDAGDADYFIVPLASPVVQIMGSRPSPGFPAGFHLASYSPSIALRPGDVIGITVFETGGPSVFGMAPLGADTLAAAAPPAPPAQAMALAPTALPMADNKPAAAAPAAGIDRSPTGSLPVMMAQSSPTTPSAPSGVTTPSAGPLPPPKTTTFPPLAVESDGDVLVPYVGRIAVAGLSPNAAAEKIKVGLARQTLRPQVLVTVLGDKANIATVGGDANRPGPVTLTLRGERLLDVLGQAGGSKWPAPDTEVDIVRGRSTAKVKLQTIVDNPSENVPVRPDDQIFLTHDPRSFTVLGASQKVSQYTFDVPEVSLAEAIGRAGGAIDTIGNPAGVYLFREEPVAIAHHVLDLVADPADKRPRIPLRGSRVKMVYRINMNNAEGYFLAQKVKLRDKDVLLVANAEGAQLLKFFTLVRGVTGVANDLNIFGPGGPLGKGVAVTR